MGFILKGGKRKQFVEDMYRILGVKAHSNQWMQVIVLKLYASIQWKNLLKYLQ